MNTLELRNRASSRPTTSSLDELNSALLSPEDRMGRDFAESQNFQETAGAPLSSSATLFHHNAKPCELSVSGTSQNVLKFDHAVKVEFARTWTGTGADVIGPDGKVWFQIRRVNGHCLSVDQRYEMVNKDSGIVVCIFQQGNSWIYVDRWRILTPVNIDSSTKMHGDLYEKIATVRSRTIKGAGERHRRQLEVNTVEKSFLNFGETYVSRADKTKLAVKSHSPFFGLTLEICPDVDLIKMIAIAFTRQKIRNAQLGRRSLEPIVDRVVDIFDRDL